MKAAKRSSIPWWMAFCLTLFATLLPLQAEIKFDKLEAGLDTYHDVTVTTKTDKDIYIQHSKGFANIKVTDLTPEVQERLGLNVKKSKSSGSSAVSFDSIPIDPKYAEAGDEVMTQLQSQFDTSAKNILFAALGAMVLIYLFVCFCFHKICVKAGTKPGLLVWIPILQAFPLLRAARMSGWWFLAWVLPGFSPLLAGPVMVHLGEQNLWILLLPNLISLLGSVIWCIKICQARNVSVIFGVMLLLPLLNIIAFLYLAFGPTGEVNGIPSDPEYNAKRNQDTSFFYQT